MTSLLISRFPTEKASPSDDLKDWLYNKTLVKLWIENGLPNDTETTIKKL